MLSELDIYVVYLFAALVLLPLVFAMIGLHLDYPAYRTTRKPRRRPMARRAR